jgi:hypothetical protein
MKKKKSHSNHLLRNRILVMVAFLPLSFFSTLRQLNVPQNSRSVGFEFSHRSRQIALHELGTGR